MGADFSRFERSAGRKEVNSRLRDAVDCTRQKKAFSHFLLSLRHIQIQGGVFSIWYQSKYN